MTLRNRSKIINWVSFIIWCMAITWLAYGSSLSLPFFFDDLVHLPYVDEYSLTEMWQTAGNLAYYRPLPFTVWGVMYAGLGRHDTLIQHGFNLAVHLLNGILVGWLAGQLWQGTNFSNRRGTALGFRSFLSATLFLLFPFSYQAVPWVGSLAHLLVTFLILLSLATYWQFRSSGRMLWAVMSLIFTFLAPFAHENGILVSPLLAAILFTGQDWRDRWRRNLRHVIMWALPALIWLPIWWFAPKALDGSVTIRGGETVLQNAAYFFQGAGYPITWLGGWLRDELGFNDMAVTAVLSTLALGGAALILRLGNASRRSLLPWSWIFIAALPALFFLSFDYVINGPRLLMLASVGAAWLWTDVALVAMGWIQITDRHSFRRRWPRLALVLALIGLLLLQNYSFIRNRMSLHQILGEAQRQAISMTTKTNEGGEAAIFVNLPTWIAPGASTYALGHEGVQFLPNYAPPETFISVNTGRPAELEIIRQEAIRPEMPYFYGLGSATTDWQAMAGEGGEVYVAEYQPEAINLRFAGALEAVQNHAEPLSLFEDPENEVQIRLVSASARNTGQGMAVDLSWTAEERPSDHITAFVHVVDSQGQLVGQLDGDPLYGSYSLSQLGPPLVVQERRMIPVEDGNISVLVGLYDRLRGDRLPAYNESGQRWPDDAVLITVE